MVEAICKKYGIKVKKINDNLYINQNTKVEINCHKLLHELSDKILLVSDTIRKERDKEGFTSKIGFLYCILESNSSNEYILECFNKAKTKYGNVFIMAIEDTDDVIQGISTIYGKEERGQY